MAVASLDNVRISPRWVHSSVVAVVNGGLIMSVVNDSQAPAGGPRGVCQGFSADSRRRLNELLMSLDWSSVAAGRKGAAVGRGFFVSLTFPGFPTPDYAKARLGAFRDRLTRRYGPLAVVWRMELQQRGAVHFHLAVFFDAPQSWRSFRDWVVLAWRELVPGMSAGGQDVRTVYGGGAKLMHYLAKYLAKLPEVEASPDALYGRWWGVWNKPLLPVGDVVELELSPAETARLIGRLRSRGRRVGSRYLADLRPWSGPLVFGDPAQLVAELLME